VERHEITKTFGDMVDTNFCHNISRDLLRMEDRR
jgi:hypothetical protein